MPKPETPAPLKNNPHGDDFETMPDDGRRFQILHTGVGAYRQSEVKDGKLQVVTAKHFGPGAELPRLVARGAIRELAPSEAQDAEIVPLVDPNTMPIDAQFATGNPHTEPLGKPELPQAPAAAPVKVDAKGSGVAPPAPTAPAKSEPK